MSAARLAAYERGARADAALRDARHHFRDALGDIFAAGDVIQEKEGLRAAADDIVDAHGDAVYAYRVVLVQAESVLQLGADAVRAADEHGLLHAGEVEREQPAEPAYIGQRARGHSARDMFLHELDGAVTRGYVHARLLIGCAERLFHQRASARWKAERPARPSCARLWAAL